MIWKTALLYLSKPKIPSTRTVSEHLINPACCFEFNIVGANTSVLYNYETFVVANLKTEMISF